MKPLPLLLFVCLSLALFGEAHGAVAFSDPPGGSVIANFDGALNARTLTCNVTNEQGLQISTSWSLWNVTANASRLQLITTTSELFSISGDPIVSHPQITYQNRLTILRFTSALDKVLVFCGNGERPRQANFTLRIYRAPNLRNNLVVKIEENSENVPVNLLQEPTAYPQPTSFTWRKDGQPLDSSSVSLTYSNATFAKVMREDDGVYTVSATNFVLGSSTQQVGTDTGSFRLDVIYGPSFEAYGPARVYGLLGDRLSLLCGTGLDSNPPATITWTAPDGTAVMDNARYDLENGPEAVRLTLSSVARSDDGIWHCDVIVESEGYIVNDNGLVLEDRHVIGVPITSTVQLVVIVPPSAPRSLSVTNAQSTSLFIRWTPPLQFESPLSYYLVTVRDQMSAEITVLNTTTTTTSFNISGLLPGVTYELTVAAVSQGGDIVGTSVPSNTVIVSTTNTVPALVCDALESSGGLMTARWSYTHTGGQPLTSLSVSYLFMEGTTINRVPVDVTSVGVTTVEVRNLTTGFEYMFNITAANSVGAASVLCGPTLHAIGRPVMPTFGTLMSKPNDSEVILTIRTVASGINDPEQLFKFVIVPICEGVEEAGVEYPFPDYQSGQFERVVVEALEKGGSYVFRAVATNIFGSSEPAYSPAIILQGGPRPLTPTKASNIDIIIGGAIGGVALIVVSTVILIIIVAVRATSRHKGRSFNVRERQEGEI